MYKSVDWLHPISQKWIIYWIIKWNTSKRDHQWRLIDRKNPLIPMDNNSHSTNEHVFGQRVGPAIKIDLLKNRESTNNKHKPKSK